MVHMVSTGTSRALARTTATTAIVRPIAPLTAADRAAIDRHGRDGLIKRLKVRVTVAWSAAASTVAVGFPLMMSEDLAVSDTGIVVTIMSLPAVLAGAHAQARLARVRAEGEPNRATTARSMVAEPGEPDELSHLRDRLMDLAAAVEPVYPDLAAATRQADAEAHQALLRQARALASLAGADDPATAAARDEIQRRLEDGLGEYRHLIAQTALLLARSEAHLTPHGAMRGAADLASTYSEGIRISEQSGSS